MQRYLFLTALLLLGLLVSGCSSSAPATPAAGSFPNTPEGVVRKMLDSIEENDANQYLDSVTAEDRKEPGFFFYKQLAQGLMGVIGLGSIDAAKPKVAFRDITLSTVPIGDAAAIVSVDGKMRDLNVAMETDFNSVVKVVRRDGVWLCALKESDFDEGAFKQRALDFVLQATSYRATGTEQNTTGQGAVQEAQTEIEESLVEGSGRIKRSWKDGRTTETVWLGEQVCQCSDLSKNLCTCVEDGKVGDWRASMAEIISASGSQLGAHAIGAAVEHGSKIEQFEGRMCRTYWEKETYEWGHILYELRIDMATAQPVTWTVTDIYPEEKHITRKSKTRYLEFDQPITIELPSVTSDTSAGLSPLSTGENDVGSAEELAFREKVLRAIEGVKSVRASGTETNRDLKTGQVTQSTIEYTSKENAWMRTTMRPDLTHEQVQVGKRHCQRTTGADWSCNDEEWLGAQPDYWVATVNGVVDEFMGAIGYVREDSGSYLTIRQGKSCRLYYVILAVTFGTSGNDKKLYLSRIVSEYCFDMDTLLPLTSKFTSVSGEREGDSTIETSEYVSEMSFFGFNDPIEISLPHN